VIWLQTPTVFGLGGRNHFSQLLKVHGVNDIRQTEIHTEEPLVPEANAFVVEMTTEKPTQLIKAGGRTFCSEIQQLINSIWNKDKLTKKWKELSTVPVYKKGMINQIVVIIGYHFCQLHTKFYPPSSCQG
jgi:hypothetical protein